MGFCQIVLKTFLYTSLTLTAVLVYLHIECQKESEESKNNRFNAEYHPDQTDCVAELPFVKPGVDKIVTVLGPEFILKQVTPCALLKLITISRHFLFGEHWSPADADLKNVTILDFKKHKPGTFKETGFTYIELEEEPKTQNWRLGSEDIDLFMDQIEPHIRKLYPKVKKMILLSHLIRGGSQFGDQPV